MNKGKEQNGRPTGIGVDSSGGPLVDPTKNVLDLVEARGVAAANLRKSDKEIVKISIKNLRKDLRGRNKHILAIIQLRAEFQSEVVKLQAEHRTAMAKAEADRLNSIRQVDREEVAKTAVAANTAITTLASTTLNMADTLRKEVANTAIAQENRFGTFVNDVTKRLSAIELSQSEGKGKGARDEPAFERMSSLVEKFVANQQTTTGKSEGFSSSWAILIGAVGMILSLIAIGSFLARSMTPAPAATPQVIYMPAPATPAVK